MVVVAVVIEVVVFVVVVVVLVVVLVVAAATSLHKTFCRFTAIFKIICSYWDLPKGLRSLLQLPALPAFAKSKVIFE
jgi:hypothetical protein